MNTLHAKAIAFATFALAPLEGIAQGAPFDCTTLSPQAEVIPFTTKTGPKYLLVRDGDIRYRVDLFQPSEGAALTSPVRISSQGLPRTLCSSRKTVVKSVEGRLFWVTRIAPIDTDRYERIARRLAPEGRQAAQLTPDGSGTMDHSGQASQ